MPISDEEARKRITESQSGQEWETLQRARANLRRASYAYAHCKKEKFYKDRAGAELEKASILHALAAAVWGSRANCAKAAGKVGTDWYESLEPETLLKNEP